MTIMNELPSYPVLGTGIFASTNNVGTYICSWERLHDFTVGVTDVRATPSLGPDKSPYELCAAHPGAFGDSVNLTCSPAVTGRFLFIQLEPNGMLTLCEVEVFVVAAGTSSS